MYENIADNFIAGEIKAAGLISQVAQFIVGFMCGADVAWGAFH